MADESYLPEGQKSEAVNLQYIFSVVRRRYVHFLLSAFLGWFIVWTVSWILPARYKSETLILVDQSATTKAYVDADVSEELQTRLQSITQQILSRTRLLSIIDKLHLYNGKPEGAPDEKVEAMRKDIDIELVRDPHNQQISAFKIFYTAAKPDLAQQVTTELTQLFIADNVKVRQKESEDTTRFIQSQLDNARATLSAQEARILEFKAKYSGELPSQQASNLQMLSSFQIELQEEQDALNTAKQQRIQALIEQNRAVSEYSPPVESGTTAFAQMDRTLEALRSQLAILSNEHTDQYPGIQSLKAKIAETETLRNEQMVREQENSPSEVQQNGEGGASSGATTGQNAALFQLQNEIQASQTSIANRERAIGDLKLNINAYQRRLNDEPAREQELADLTRNYDQAKNNYDDLLKKMNGSQLATNMEETKQGEHFEILDPPSLPIKPFFPNHLKLCGIGLGVGLVLGILVVCSFEMIDNRLYSESEIEALLPVRILSEIPKIPVMAEERSSNRKLLMRWAFAALVLIAMLAGSSFSYLHN